MAVDTGHWFVVNTYSGYENKVKENLLHRIASMEAEDKIYEVVVPTEIVEEVRHGERRRVEKKMFQGYVLVRMAMNDDAWYVVRNTPGVVNFVGAGNRPTPLPQFEVDSIFKQMKGEVPRAQVSLTVGETVKIIDGPFSEFLGSIDEVNQERGRVRVMVSFFGRDTPVELDFLQVERVRG
jgi:transcription termination/antitermination protein NusG